MGIASAGELVLSCKFSRALVSIAGATQDAALFVSTISKIAAVTDSFLESAASTSKAPANLNIQALIRNGVRSATQGIGLWNLYESCKSYQFALIEVAALLDESSEKVDYLIRRSNDFLTHYERYAQLHDFETTFDLLVIANELDSRLVGLQIAAEVASENLAPPAIRLGDAELEIISDKFHSSPKDLASVLVALSEIYAVLADLLDVSLYQEPLEIEKIESGSLYIKLKGAVRVIRAASGVLKQAFTYGMSNHTLSGRFDQLPRAAESIERVLRIKETLAAQGLDVSGMDAEIESAALKLAKHTNTLVSHMNDVGLNGEIYGIKEQLLLAYAQEGDSKPKLLGHGDE